MKNTLVNTDSRPSSIIRQLFNNIDFINKNDLKVLEFLGKKCLHEDKKVGFIEENKCYKTEEPCNCSGLCRENC
jgi:hypothetical protein